MTEVRFFFLDYVPYSNRISPFANRIWLTAVAGVGDSVSSVSASACHIGGPNSVNPGQILLVYSTISKATHLYKLLKTNIS